MTSHVQIYDDVTDDLVKIALAAPLEGEPSTALGEGADEGEKSWSEK